jgi:DNA-binding transcriptional LysR family regulator
VKRGVAGNPGAVGLLADYAVRAEVADGSVAVLPVRPEMPRKQVMGLVGTTAAGHPAVAALLDELAALLTPVKTPSAISR